MSYALTHRTFEEFETSPWFECMHELARDAFPRDDFGYGYGVAIMFNQITDIHEGSASLPEDLEGDQVEDFLLGAMCKAVLSAKQEKGNFDG
jgi:hypothetical protein